MSDKPKPHVRRNYGWLDLETTGLEPGRDQILEVALIVTTPELNELVRFSAPIKPRGELRMTQFAWQQHAKSGLLDECASSTWSLDAAITMIGNYIAAWCGDRDAGRPLLAPLRTEQKPMLAGSSVHFDRAFLGVHASHLLDSLHYRQIDVSGMREDMRNAGHPLEDPPGLELPHRALPDLELSIALLRRIRGIYTSPPSVHFPGTPEGDAL